ncbi:MAG: TIGR03668 family PPOX class F420-dependent oxidoreductase [Reyranella sp.]|nr:TIGR03668 family PPOX class F420-dependent oxidoreductase [Reyranella sp.]
MLSVRERHFIDTRRIGHLATADSRAIPHVVPACFSLAGGMLYIAIDQKPKRNRGKSLKRLSKITDNPRVAVVFDHYDEDWQRLGWVMLHGRAEILTEGIEHDRAQSLMRSRYRQLAAMQIEQLPVIAIHIERVASWGDLGS